MNDQDIQDQIVAAQEEAKAAAMAVALGTVRGASAGFKLAGYFLEEAADQVADNIEDAKAERQTRRVAALTSKRNALHKQIAAGVTPVAVKQRLAAIEKELADLTGETPAPIAPPKPPEDESEKIPVKRNRIGQFAANGSH